jgi:hypothetical protein
MKKRTAFLLWAIVAMAFSLIAPEDSSMEHRSMAMLFAGLAGFWAVDKDEKL